VDLRLHSLNCGPSSSVCIATGYGLEGAGIESRWEPDFPHLSRRALGPTQPPVQWVPGLSPEVKSGRGVTLTPHPLLVPLVMKEFSYTSTLPTGFTATQLELLAGYLSLYSDGLRGGRSGDRIPVEARFSAPVQTGPGAHPASCTMGTVSLPEVKSGRGVTLTPHPLLVPLAMKE